MAVQPIKYIQKIEISGLWDRYDVEWNLHSDVNVLAGINGSGKTTILDRIYAILSGKKLSENTFSTTIFFNDNMRIESLNENDSKNFKQENNEGSSVAILPSFKQISEFLVTEIINNLRSRILASICINILKTFDSELKPQELLQKVDDDTKTELDFELWKLQKEYLNYQVNLGKKLKSNKGNPDDNSTHFHDKFLEIIDNLFSETHKKVNRDKNELEFLLGDKEIKAYQLSSGEKQLLVILLTVLVQDNKPAILLMDEPEISLHMKWQRNLITYIRELNPNVQLIIATHSPDIIMDGWMDKVFNMCDIAKDSQ